MDETRRVKTCGTEPEMNVDRLGVRCHLPPMTGKPENYIFFTRNPPVASNFNVLTSVARYLLAAFVLFWRVSAAEGQDPLVNISRDGNGLEINFIGTLQSADSVAGPWLDESSQTP